MGICSHVNTKHYLIVHHTYYEHVGSSKDHIHPAQPLTTSIFISASVIPGGRLQMLAAVSQSERSREAVCEFDGKFFPPQGKKGVYTSTNQRLL